MARFEFRLPDIGEGVAEGEVVAWHVKPGDIVKEDDPMVEVMTDKATVTIGAPKSGKIVELGGAVGANKLIRFFLAMGRSFVWHAKPLRRGATLRTTKTLKPSIGAMRSAGCVRSQSLCLPFANGRGQKAATRACFAATRLGRSAPARPSPRCSM